MKICLDELEQARRANRHNSHTTPRGDGARAHGSGSGSCITIIINNVPLERTWQTHVCVGRQNSAHDNIITALSDGRSDALQVTRSAFVTPSPPNHQPASTTGWQTPLADF